jgi:hypothetical protein
MFPQTHIYFAEWITGTKADQVTLGSMLPDMLVGGFFDHRGAHTMGQEVFEFLKKHNTLLIFGHALLTHGFVPEGLDYYGDEKYLDYERGYCFEKAKPFIMDTVEACNIPVKMGWWKAHNIVEMGVELLVSARDYYSDRIISAFTNRALIAELDELFANIWPGNTINFAHRVERFVDFFEHDKADAQSLAAKYNYQMFLKHKIEIDTKKVARLIDKAAESISDEVDDFFTTAGEMVKNNIASLDHK